jgi:hypothetical protein
MKCHLSLSSGRLFKPCMFCCQERKREEERRWTQESRVVRDEMNGSSEQLDISNSSRYKAVMHCDFCWLTVWLANLTNLVARAWWQTEFPIKEPLIWVCMIHFNICLAHPCLYSKNSYLSGCLYAILHELMTCRYIPPSVQSVYLTNLMFIAVLHEKYEASDYVILSTSLQFSLSSSLLCMLSEAFLSCVLPLMWLAHEVSKWIHAF